MITSVKEQVICIENVKITWNAFLLYKVVRTLSYRLVCSCITFIFSLQPPLLLWWTSIYPLTHKLCCHQATFSYLFLLTSLRWSYTWLYFHLSQLLISEILLFNFLKPIYLLSLFSVPAHNYLLCKILCTGTL